MRKLILVFAIFMAFAATSFAYTDVLNISVTEVDYQEINQSMPNAIGMYYSMGCTVPGFVAITLYDIYGNILLSDRYDYEGYSQGTSGSCMGRLGGMHVEIAVFSLDGEETNGNGIYSMWGD